MAGRLVTVRHGRPALSRKDRMSWRDYGSWWDRYEAGSLQDGQCAPEELKEIAENSDIIFSSTLKRAMETARLAAGDDCDVTARELFVEAPLPAPPLPFARMKPGPWGALSRTYWFLGYCPSAESHIKAWKRAFKAADLLMDTTQTGDVMLCAHGYFNWMMDVAIRLKGGKRIHNGGSRHWAWRSYDIPENKRTQTNSFNEAAE